MEGNERLLKELKRMRNTEKKAEIEVLSSLSHHYLSFSLKEKIDTKDWI